MLPIWGMTLWGTYRIASALYNRRVGWWTTILTCLLPPFFINSVEFRTDDLWAMLWILAVAVLINGRIRPLRSLAAGLILGLAVSVSMKSVLLLACLAFGGLATMTLCHREFSGTGWSRRMGLNLVAATSGILLVPSILVLWFYSQGAFYSMYYGVIQHNLLPMDNPRLLQPWMLAPMLIGILCFAWARIIRRGIPGTQTKRTAIVFITVMCYIAAVETIWPLITDQDFLPAWPLLVVLIAPLLDRPLPRRLVALWQGRDSALKPLRIPTGLMLAAVLEAAVLMTVLLMIVIHNVDRTREDLDAWRAVLNLTSADDYVMDEKGDLIFRRRPVYYVFEGITMKRIRRGLIDPAVQRHLIETKTTVIASSIRSLPEKDRIFIESNYISVGPLLVAGMLLTPQATGSSSFEIAIPAEYRIVTPSGNAIGELDGTPYDGARFLCPGQHEFKASSGEQRLALVLARAIDKGYFPKPPEI